MEVLLYVTLWALLVGSGWFFSKLGAGAFVSLLLHLGRLWQERIVRDGETTTVTITIRKHRD